MTLPVTETAVALPGGLFARATPASDLTLYRNESVPLATAPPSPAPQNLKRLPDWYVSLTKVPVPSDPRLLAVMESLRKGSPSPSAIVARLMKWFKTQDFVYSTHLPDVPATDVADFLYRVKSGYCEQYAAAFASVLRMVSLPTRVVLGFRGGEFNEFDDKLTVRNSDAHAWVEYWDQDSTQWLSVDPVLAVDRSADKELMRNGWVRRLRHLWEAASSRWTLFRVYTGAQVEVWSHQSSAGLAKQRNVLTLGFAAVLLFIFFFVFITKARRDWRARRSNFLARIYAGLFLANDPETLYCYYCEYLAKYGLARISTEGPLTYLTRCVRAWPEAEAALVHFTDSYLSLRYGTEQLDGSQLRDSLKVVKKAIRHAPSSSAKRS